MEGLCHSIENYLKDGEGWKVFINESGMGTDFENASLNNLEVTIGKVSKSKCEFTIDISFNILEDESNVHENGLAKFNDNKGEITITNVEKV